MKSLLAFLPLALLMQPTTRPAHTPILPGFTADPSARVFHDKIYVYPSHDLPGNKNWDMFDFHVFSSDDAVNFKDEGKIFSVDDLTWAKHQLWAPDCVEKNGTYYLYFAAEGQIGVATSSSPTGPFKDALGRPLLEKKTAGLYTIDPAILQDDDGQAYLYFGNSNGHVGFAKLNPDMISLNGLVQVLSVPNYHEGIWVHKHAGKYYFSYPSHVGDKIANLMEYSIAPTPTGPFDHKGVLLDNRSRNVHGSIFDFKGQTYVCYHIQGPSPYERRTYLDKLTYNQDGTFQPLGTVTGIEEPTPNP
jgi:beta-xylosidase